MLLLYFTRLTPAYQGLLLFPDSRTRCARIAMMAESKKSAYSQATATQAAPSHMRTQVSDQVEQIPKRAFSADVARPSSLASSTRRSAAILQLAAASLRGVSHHVKQFPEEDDRSAQDFAQCGVGRSWLVLMLPFPNDAECSSYVVSVKSRVGLNCVGWISEVSEVGRRLRAWAAVTPMMGRFIVHGS
jgi:hypothetical protein